MSENLVRVPRWIIRKAWEPNGIRLPRRISLTAEPPKVETKVVGFIPKSGIKSASLAKDAPQVHINNEHTIVLSSPKLEFEHWEYRFWSVDIVNWEPMCTECRCCGQVFSNRVPRRKHGKEKGCFDTLTESYKLLLKDMKCVICDKHTLDTAWGVPLCKTTMCMDTWMHRDAQPNALLQALSLDSMNRMSIGD